MCVMLLESEVEKRIGQPFGLNLLCEETKRNRPLADNFFPVLNHQPATPAT
jgi:hypothetical protein